MLQKTYKVQAAAQLLDMTVDKVRRYVDEAGIEVERQENGPRTRQFTLENIYAISRWAHENRSKTKPKKRVIATIYAPKGGVGKTTLAANLACIFPLLGVRTLVVDLDFQANLTLAFGYDAEVTHEDAAELGLPDSEVVDHHFGCLFKDWPYGRQSLESVLKKPYGKSGPHLIPADLNLDRLDTILTFDALEGKNGEVKIAALLHEALTKKNPDIDFSEYDLILFDAAPAKNRMTRGALLASDFVITPVSMEKFSTKAISYLSTVLTEMRENTGRSPDLLVVGNFYIPSRTRAAKQIALISNQYPGALLDVSIRRSEEFPKVLSDDDDMPPLFLAKPTSDAADELKAVAKELLKRMGMIDG